VAVGLSGSCLLGGSMNDLWDLCRNPERGFASRERAANWPDGLLIGNGSIGSNGILPIDLLWPCCGLTPISTLR
jgi:hypothetical protein